MPSPRRLPALACCLLLLTAGCSALTNTGPESVPLDGIALGNGDEEPHRFHVRVVENGTTTYEETVVLNGTADDTETRSRSLTPDAIDGSGNYTVFVRMDDGDRERVALREEATRLRECSAAGEEVWVSALVAPSGDSLVTNARCTES